MSTSTSDNPTADAAAVPAQVTAVVVLSGGQDSTTCLYWAIKRWGRDALVALTFDYGQRHRVELACAAKIAELAGVPQRVLPIDTFVALGGNSLVDTDQDVTSTGPGSLPNTFVPGRNLVFLTFAAAWAWQLGAKHLVTGVAQTDYSGYPDCREETIQSLQQSLRLGMASEICIHTPLMHMDKAATVTLARDLGALEAMAWSHTCYQGEQPPCGRCPACVLRARGFANAGIADPLVARLAGPGQGQPGQ